MKIHLEQGQKLVMNQQMTMAIEMLQMDAQELDTYLQELALENPMLEIHPPKETGIQSWNTVSANHSADDGGSLGELKAAADGSLKGEVREQIVTAHVPELMRRELLYLLGEMDAQGYLPADTGDLQAFFGDRQRYENAVAVLQSMDPPGVAHGASPNGFASNCAAGASPMSCLTKFAGAIWRRWPGDNGTSSPRR